MPHSGCSLECRLKSQWRKSLLCDFCWTQMLIFESRTLRETQQVHAGP